MTSEERMAYYQKQKYGKSVKETGSKGNSGMKGFRLGISLLLLIIFLTLDYSGCKVGKIGSEEIIRMVTTDLSMEKFFEFDFSLLGN